VPGAAVCCGVAAKARDEQASREASNVERIMDLRIGDFLFLVGDRF
jgi:hypothetical protein